MKVIIAIFLGLVFWMGISAWTTVKPLGTRDLPACEIILRKNGIQGQISAAQLVMGGGRWFLQVQFQVSPGLVHEMIVPLELEGDMPWHAPAKKN